MYCKKTLIKVPIVQLLYFALSFTIIIHTIKTNAEPFSSRFDFVRGIIETLACAVI